MVRDPYRSLTWHGAVVFLLANVSGWLLFAVPLKNPRMMLATHLAGLFGALLMMVIAMLGPQLEAGSKARGTLVWSLVISQYSFVLAGVYAAVAGTSSRFAAPPDMRGSAVQEAVATAGNSLGVLGSTVAAILLLWGLRATNRPPK